MFNPRAKVSAGFSYWRINTFPITPAFVRFCWPTGCQVQIRNLEDPLKGHEEIWRLEIEVNEASVVNVLQSPYAARFETHTCL